MYYLHGLSKAIKRGGGKILQAHATTIEGGKDATVHTRSKHVVRCSSVVVATNAPINDNASIYTKQAPFRTYVISAPIPTKAFPKILLWDTGQYSKEDTPPYHYIRTEKIPDDASHMMLIVGGEDHHTGEANDAELRFHRLEEWTKKRFPIGEIAFRWSGQVLEPADGFAMIGRKPFDDKNVFIATGDSGNGITHGIIAGMLLKDLIVGKKNPWEHIYEPSRFRVHATTGMLKEGFRVACDIADYVTPGTVQSEDAVAPGRGAVIRHGLKKIALYRDPKGTLHRMSAVCPHKGCIVRWNSAEKSFDCPCHGSRFDCHGKVVNGPSFGDLEPVTEPSS
jgi:nitrite reductase/ring-hydroxylating ferredoxin subunit